MDTELYKANEAQIEAWAKVTAIWREAKKNADDVMVKPHNKPTEESLHKWIVSTNGLYNKATEAFDNAMVSNKEWVKAANDSQIKA